MTEAAEAAGLVNMVNLTYRNAAALQTARRMVEAGEIGEVRHVQASYLQCWLTGRHWGDWRTEERWLWRLSSAHGSKGVLGDIGVHILDFVTYGTGLDIVAPARPDEDLRQGRGRRHRRLHARRQRQRRDDRRVLQRRARRRPHEPLRHRQGQRPRPHDPRRQGRAQGLGRTTTTSSLEACLGPDIETQTWTPVELPPTPRNEERFVIALLSGENGEPDFRHATRVQKLLDLAFVSDAEGRMLPVPA